MEIKIPTEIISLPSKGLLYPEGHVLKSGEIEMKYMTAKEEDIITNINFIKQGIVIDKLLQSLIVTPIKYDDLLICDKNAIIIAARILGYGKDYDISYIDDNGNVQKDTVDLSLLKEKKINYDLLKGGNEFKFTLPNSKNIVTFKFLTHGDDKNIEAEIKGLEKINPNSSYKSTTRLKYIITSVNNIRDKGKITEFVDKMLLASDARALRNYYEEIVPDIELKYIPTNENYTGEGIEFEIGADFFWPDSRI